MVHKWQHCWRCRVETAMCRLQRRWETKERFRAIAHCQTMQIRSIWLSEIVRELWLRARQRSSRLLDSQCTTVRFWWVAHCSDCLRPNTRQWSWKSCVRRSTPRRIFQRQYIWKKWSSETTCLKKRLCGKKKHKKKKKLPSGSDSEKTSIAAGVIWVDAIRKYGPGVPTKF